MSIATGTRKLFSIEAHNKIGGNRHFGNIMPGDARFGDETKILCNKEIGRIDIGNTHYGDVYEPAGIYQKCHGKNHTNIRQCRWHVSKNPRSDAQNTMRAKFAAGAAAWHALTDDERLNYNILSKKRRGYGYNLFLSQWMQA